MLYCTILYYPTQYYTVLWYVIVHYTIIYDTIIWYNILYCQGRGEGAGGLERPAARGDRKTTIGATQRDPTPKGWKGCGCGIQRARDAGMRGDAFMEGDAREKWIENYCWTHLPAHSSLRPPPSPTPPPPHARPTRDRRSYIQFFIYLRYYRVKSTIDDLYDLCKLCKSMLVPYIL